MQISKAYELGIKEVCLPSAGNAAGAAWYVSDYIITIVQCKSLPQQIMI